MTSNNKTDSFEVGWVSATGGQWMKRRHEKVAFNVDETHQVPVGHVLLDSIAYPGEQPGDVSGIDRNVRSLDQIVSESSVWGEVRCKLSLSGIHPPSDAALLFERFN